MPRGTARHHTMTTVLVLWTRGSRADARRTTGTIEDGASHQASELTLHNRCHGLAQPSTPCRYAEVVGC